LDILLNVDASTIIGWGDVLSQLQVDGTIRPARFESGLWSDAEKKYDAVKLECRGLITEGIEKVHILVIQTTFPS